MKNVKQTLTYDGASLDQVAEMLADPAFREQVCEHQGVLSKSVTITPQGDGMDVVIEQTQSAKGVPSFAQKFIGDTIQIVQTESWSSPTRAEIRVEIPGKPGEMKGTASLAESGGGVAQTVDLNVKVSIPLVGGKLEGLIADLLTKALQAENEVGRQWLGGR